MARTPRLYMRKERPDAWAAVWTSASFVALFERSAHRREFKRMSSANPVRQGPIIYPQTRQISQGHEAPNLYLKGPQGLA